MAKSSVGKRETKKSRELTTQNPALFCSLVAEVLGRDPQEISLETALISGEHGADSVQLVELCVRLEDWAESEGFQFDWTSEKAMSATTGIFRTVGSLFEEFVRQGSGPDS